MTRSTGEPIRLQFLGRLKRLDFRLAMLCSPLVALIVGLYIAVAYRDVDARVSELGHAALNLLEQGFIGNPYNEPTGPTAHVSPISTLLLAAAYAGAGGNSAAARVILSLVCLACYCFCCFAALRTCSILRVRPLSMLVVVVMTTLIPFRLYDAIVPFRQWDQPYAALLLMCGLLVTVRQVTAPTTGYRAIGMLGVLTGAGALCSPMVIPAFASAAMVIVGQRSSCAGRVRLGALYVLTACVLVLPWGVRNERVFGAFIVTRSNFPLEFLVGNLGSPRSADVTAARMTYHPNFSPDAVRRINAIGELRYMAELRTTAMAWVEMHPMDLLVRSMTRVRLAFLPPRDTIEWRPVLGETGTYWAFTAFGALNLAALLMAPILLRHRLIWLAFSVLPLVPYFMTHMNTRYTYPVFFPSVCLISVTLDRMRAAAALRCSRA